MKWLVIILESLGGWLFKRQMEVQLKLVDLDCHMISLGFPLICETVSMETNNLDGLSRNESQHDDTNAGSFFHSRQQLVKYLILP